MNYILFRQIFCGISCGCGTYPAETIENDFLFSDKDFLCLYSVELKIFSNFTSENINLQKKGDKPMNNSMKNTRATNWFSIWSDVKNLSMTRKIVAFAVVAGIFVSCSNEDTVPDTPNTPVAGRHLYLSGSAGDNNAATRATWTNHDKATLSFMWDYSVADTTASELKMAFVKGGSCLKTTKGNRITDARILKHTDSDKAEDSHWAVFETIEGFNPEMPESEYEGYTVYAVTPINDANNSIMEVDENGNFSTMLKMPTTFIQTGKDNLEHLSNYVYMYAEGVLTNCTATLSFYHLAAYLRFKIYNWRGEPATLYGVEMEVVDADGNVAPALGIQADYSANGFNYTPASDGCGIQVDIADGGIVFDDKVYLFASVFPVGLENPFENKTMRFSLIAQDPTGVAAQGEYKYLTYELSGEVFKNVTGSYDWIPGELYTFHLYLDDVPTE